MSDPKATSFRLRGVLAQAFLIPTGAVALFSHPFTRPGTWDRTGLVLLSWICFLPGAVMRLWATLYIGRRKSREMVREGPYSICRNPLYLGSFLIGCGAALQLESPVFLAGVLFTAFVYARWIIPREEAFLERIFGERYRSYRREVPGSCRDCSC